MQELLDKLLAEMRKINSPAVNYLNDGISGEEIQILLSSTGVQLPKEAIELYKWHNGYNDLIINSKNLGEIWFFDRGFFPSFKRSLENYGSHIEYYWEKTLFPLFEDGGGDSYLINCNESSASFGSIFYYSPADWMFEGVIPIFNSLQDMIKTITECYRNGVYYLQDDGTFASNTEGMIELCKRLNPNVAYWKLFDD
jgi:cell wall assembly regulator SMI1